MIVKLINIKSPSDETDHEIESLSLGEHYEVIGIESDSYRIIDRDQEPCLYPSDCFQIIDNTKPAFWITEIGQNGEEYSYPPTWMSSGFFEDFFDGINETIEQFWDKHKKLYCIDNK